MISLALAALVAAIILAAVHVVTPSLRFIEGTPRSAWLSIAGGVSVAYVFVHLLPELAAAQRSVGEMIGGTAFAERHVYLIALAGLAVFYGLDRLAKISRSRREGAPVGDARAAGEGKAGTSPWVFAIHIGSFAIYNTLIGYLLLHREVMTLLALFFFTVAMALHFVVTDYGLGEDHKAQYLRFGRWILVCAVLTGLLVGYATEISEAAIAVLTAFLAGGVILNVLKEEVPSERQSRFWAFALGMVAYAAMLLTL
jgi:hypothetical protein